MMDCRRFRESLDLYVDGELSPDAMAAADGHRRDCARCAMVAREIETLRQAVRTTVNATPPPEGLEQRLRDAFDRHEATVVERTGTPARRWMAPAAAALLLVAIGLTAAAARPAWLQDSLVALMDRAIVQLAVAQPLDLEATLLCRDCELHDRHGESALCDRFGHRGALVTSDGRIWNIMEQDASLDLVRNEALLGQRVRVHGTIYREAGTISVDRYEVVRALVLASR